MSLSNIIDGLLNLKREVNTKHLPSMGLFYKDDFRVWIKKADIEHVIEYEYKFVKDDVGVIIDKLKSIVSKNTILSSGYSFIDIKSIDIIYIFMEIVKLTNNKPINLLYGGRNEIEFSHDNFNYFNISDELMNHYNNDLKCFDIDGWKYSLPSIGIEDSLTNFLIGKTMLPNYGVYNNYFYDFTHFLMDKNKLTNEELDNLIQIFNFDIDPTDLVKIMRILDTFHPIQKYSFIKENKVIEVSPINLENIWK